MLQYVVPDARFWFAHADILRHIDVVGSLLHFRILRWPELEMQLVGVRQNHHALAAGAQLVHDRQRFRTHADKHRLPASGELRIAQGNIELVTQPGSKLRVADFAPLVLLEGLVHAKTALQRGKRHASQIAPDAEYPIEIDINNHIA